MEENNVKKNEGQEKISYDQLKNYYAELRAQYDKAMAHIQELHQALDSREMTSFALTSMFKVMEHPNRYNEKFVNWCASNIQASVTAMVEAINASGEEKKEEAGEAE